jgi:hypothetical protein
MKYLTETNAIKFDDVDLPIKWADGSTPSNYDKVCWKVLRGKVILTELLLTFAGCAIIDNYPNNNYPEKSAGFPVSFFTRYLGEPVTVLA